MKIYIQDLCGNWDFWFECKNKKKFKFVLNETYLQFRYNNIKIK